MDTWSRTGDSLIFARGERSNDARERISHLQNSLLTNHSEVTQRRENGTIDCIRDKIEGNKKECGMVHFGLVVVQLYAIRWGILPLYVHYLSDRISTSTRQTEDGVYVPRKGRERTR